MALLLVSNRLPVSISKGPRGELTIVRSGGGLATGLRQLHERSGAAWLGWLGAPFSATGSGRALVEALAEKRIVPVNLPDDDARSFYEGFANGVLWPLFHYLVGRVPLHAHDWDAYVRINERFADAVAAFARPGDVVWIHDYQLMLVPRLLRQRRADVRIGFFLHIPFPSADIFRTLPWRESLLEGLLGADLVGFHTHGYRQHFTESLLSILGVEAIVDRVEYEGRCVRLGTFPMGIDAARFEALAASSRVAAETSSMRAELGNRKLLLGVDRLDYTKGLLRRLLAFERLLEREPSWRGRLRFIQIAVPSREHVGPYRDFRREVETLVGRINGAHASVHGSPIHYLYRSVADEQLVALYRAADVMLVTPLRDGMNLVAKEFVASRTDHDGVLVLSELAGSAAELGEALRVNPYDVDGIATAMDTALRMDSSERRQRMSALHERVASADANRWANSFMDALDTAGERSQSAPISVAHGELDRLAERLAGAPALRLLLDYDGTLVPIATTPALAAPDAHLLRLVQALASLPKTEVHVVSGRSKADLDAWLGALAIGLHAEHGLWSRRAGEEWRSLFTTGIRGLERVRDLVEEVAAQTPGAIVEIKTAGIAWHYRAVDPELGALRARELRYHLVHLLARTPFEVLSGDKVIEVRPHGVNKAIAVTVALEGAAPETAVAAFGDDRTDEDLFAAVPPTALTFVVGQRASGARYRLRDPNDVRRLLRLVLDLRSEGPPSSRQGVEPGPDASKAP